MSDDDKGYKVTDRRAFTPEGQLREDAAAAPTPPEAPTPQPPQTGGARGPLPEIDFTTFVLSLASNALIQMGATVKGEEPPPADEIDLPLARQTVDILGMLQQKTKGNLTGEEERLLDHVLYDLRMQFVAATKRS